MRRFLGSFMMRSGSKRIDLNLAAMPRPHVLPALPVAVSYFFTSFRFPAFFGLPKLAFYNLFKIWWPFQSRTLILPQCYRQRCREGWLGGGPKAFFVLGQAASANSVLASGGLSPQLRRMVDLHGLHSPTWASRCSVLGLQCLNILLSVERQAKTLNRT